MSGERAQRVLGEVLHLLQALREPADEELEADVPDARLRLTITSGPGPLGSPRGSEGRTVLAAVAPIPPLKPSYAIAVSPWARNERGALAGLKTVSYAENAMVLAWALGRRLKPPSVY